MIQTDPDNRASPMLLAWCIRHGGQDVYPAGRAWIILESERIGRSPKRGPQHVADEYFTTLSTHVLDAVRGTPASGLTVRLLSGDTQVATSRTGPDGRLPDLASDLEPGVYRLVFETGDYFGSSSHIFRRVSLDLALTERRHYHVPLLLGPFSVTTYRGA